MELYHIQSEGEMSAGTQPTHSQTRIEDPDITANPRVVELIQPVIDRLQELIREKSVSYDEWHQAVRFVIDVADSGETPLLMDVFFEATVDAVADAASAASTTAIEGPFYVPGAPMLDPPCVMPGGPTSRVTRWCSPARSPPPDGEPIVGALPDVWHSDATVPGTYSNIHPGQPAFNLRGKLRTDDEGQFELETIRPAEPVKVFETV